MSWTKASNPSAHITCIDCGGVFFLHYRTLRCPECKQAHRAKYNKKAAHKAYLLNKDKIIKRQKEYRKENPEKQKEWAARYRSRNLKKERARCREYQKENPEIFAYHTRKRKAIQRGAILPSTDMDKIHAIYVQCQEKNSRCKRVYHVDHIIPLSRGGAHHQDNLRIIAAHKNRKKHAKLDLTLGGVWADNELASKWNKLLITRDVFS